MKLLQILIVSLLILITYDYVSDFLILKSVGGPFEATGGRQSSVNSTEDTCIIGPDIFCISQWLIGSLCFISLFLLRLVFKKSVTKTVDATTSLNNDNEMRLNHQVQRKDSLLNNNLSVTSFICGSEASSCDTLGQLSPAQLQVLLEELKFSVDEKFEEVDSWINSNEQGSKLCNKRIERVERELSYIRHQMFILMSCNAKQSSALCIGDVPDTKHHAETLKELSNILAQVKQQYNENESKDMSFGEKSGKSCEITSGRQLKSELDSTGNKVSNSCLLELPKIDGEIIKRAHNNLSTLNNDMMENKEKEITNENNLSVKNFNNDLMINKDGVVVSETKNDIDTDNEENSINHIEENPLSNHMNDSRNTFENSNITIIKNLDCFNEDNTDLNRHSFIQGKVNERGDTSFLDVKEKYNNELPYSGNSYYSMNTLLEEPSQISTSLYDNTSSVMFDSSIDINQCHRDRSVSPKRSVRFAHGRDLSPSKSPTWLAVNRNPSPNRTHEKGISDSNVNGFTNMNREIKERRESSYPTVETKRPSRRTILERELTILERNVSPSPTRNRTKLKHVRSKVGDYIRGHKKQIYDKINSTA